MSVNIINVDGKCITRVMRDFADFLAQSCCKAESSHRRQPSLESLEGEEGVAPSVPEVRSTLCGDGMEGEDVCGLGRRTSFFHTEEGWGPDLTELQTMIETFKVSHDLEIEAVVTSTAQEIEAVMGECKQLQERMTQLEVKNATLEDVIAGLSSDILLNSREMESLKLNLVKKEDESEA